MIKALNEKNKIDIQEITNQSFNQYGRLVDEYDLEDLKDLFDKKTSIPEEGNIYIPDLEEAHKLEISKTLSQEFYGEMPIEIGYCNGHNVKLNALEYHKGSEINIALTDSILLVGRLQDIRDNQIDSSRLEAFYISKGQAVELYATTLHFSPCAVNEEGFKMIVILPKGTNLALENKKAKDPTLWMKNKWLIAHEEANILMEKGAYKGIKGENITIKF